MQFPLSSLSLLFSTGTALSTLFSDTLNLCPSLGARDCIISVKCNIVRTPWNCSFQTAWRPLASRAPAFVFWFSLWVFFRWPERKNNYPHNCLRRRWQHGRLTGRWELTIFNLETGQNLGHTLSQETSEFRLFAYVLKLLSVSLIICSFLNDAVNNLE
jgi:hypothetical protein